MFECSQHQAVLSAREPTDNDGIPAPGELQTAPSACHAMIDLEFAEH
jgi:hypothetical protein